MPRPYNINPDGSKFCAKCGETKAASGFWRKPAGCGLEPWCKVCKGADKKARSDAFTWSYTEKDLARFEKKIRYELHGPGCLEWSSSTGRNGYGLFYLNGRQLSAHRIAWLFAGNGEPPTWPMVLDHRCYNPGCVNVAHLRIVAQQDNTMKYARRVPGRAGTPIAFQRCD